jgi:hypothetical protein
MKNYHNIESKKSKAGHYSGYSADGRAWRITGRTGCWSAHANVTKAGSINQILMYDRLHEISTELESIK